MCRGRMVDTLEKGCWRWSCQEGGKQEEHRVDVVKKEMQKVDVTQEDARDKVRWRQMVCCRGSSQEEVTALVELT